MIAKKVLPILVIILIILFGVYLVNKRNNVISSTKNVVTKDVTKSSTLSIDPASITLKKGEEQQVKIVINSSNTITGVQLVLNYDQNIVTVKDIKSGEFLSDASILLKDIEKTPGTSSFAIGTFKPKSGKGNVILVTLMGKGKGKSNLSLSGSMVAVTNNENDDLKNVSDSTVTVY